MKVAYITARFPWGKGEAFLIDEVTQLKKAGVELLVVPRSPGRKVFHREALKILNSVVRTPLISPKIAFVFLFSFMTDLKVRRLVFYLFLHSRNVIVLLKNLAVVPKAVFVSKLMHESGIEHIHAHWGSTTSTMAFIISRITGIPWSFTLHRWDIRENNLLKEKVESASFVRCVSKKGKEEVLNIIGKHFTGKIRVIHIGVNFPGFPADSEAFGSRKREKFVIVCPANLVKIKGHRYLISACSVLVKRGVRNFRCLFFGDGPLEYDLRRMIRKGNLENYIKMCGRIPHEQLMDLYKTGKVDMVVLPSIKTVKGEEEGIPVALMEAMAYGIPVISTNTGGIPELLCGNSGIMVKEKDFRQLANVIQQLISNKNFYYTLCMKEKLKIKNEFDVLDMVRLLGKLIT